jgi:hypothetical protein
LETVAQRAAAASSTAASSQTRPRLIPAGILAEPGHGLERIARVLVLRTPTVRKRIIEDSPVGNSLDPFSS